MKIKLFNKDSYTNHGRLLGWGSGPDADWNVMFKTFLFLLIVVFVVCVLMFVKVGTGSFGSNLDDDTPPPVDAITLKHIVIHYQGVEEVFEQIKNASETTPDPSI